MGIIFYLSHQPGDALPLPQFIGLDKAAHAVAYGLLASTILYGLHPFIHDANRTAAALAVVLFCLLFGVSDEYHQGFIPGRQVSFADVAADTFGALLVAAWWHIRAARDRGRDKS